MKLKVSEIFYSLQGEGARIGTPTIFIRLQGCKAKNACFAAGIKCDTEFESGKEMSLEQIESWIIENAKHVIAKNFPKGVNELRYVRHKGQSVPEPSIKADHYWLSPHSDGFTINSENLKHCIDLCIENPKWKLSLQNHKIWNIL